MDRTLGDDIRASLFGWTVEEVRVDDPTGTPLAVLRLSRAGAEDAFVCFDATTIANADSVWQPGGGNPVLNDVQHRADSPPDLRRNPE